MSISPRGSKFQPSGNHDWRFVQWLLNISCYRNPIKSELLMNLKHSENRLTEKVTAECDGACQVRPEGPGLESVTELPSGIGERARTTEGAAHTA